MNKNNEHLPIFIRKVSVFMKKIILVITLLVIIIFYGNIKQDEVIIPEESIRFRIIPNSNSVEDIAMKEKVKEKINREINLLQDTNNINDARKSLLKNKKNIEIAINETFDLNNYDESFEVKYGNNYFPEKKYKGVTYQSGNYESLVVEIGDAKGDNFWCVLFPPLCMMESQEKNIEDNEYKFFISEIINRYF